MKKITIITGYVAAFAMMLTCIYKLQHWPGAGSVMAITGLFLSFYFPAYIIEKMQEKSEGKILSSHIAAAISAALTNAAIVFKIQHWNGAGILIVLGLTTFSLVFIPL